jgi:hypothetical protein
VLELAVEVEEADHVKASHHGSSFQLSILSDANDLQHRQARVQWQATPVTCFFVTSLDDDVASAPRRAVDADVIDVTFGRMAEGRIRRLLGGSCEKCL